MANNGVLDDVILLFILFCLVSNVCFSCIVQDSLYHNMDLGCHVTFFVGQLHLITFYRTGLGVCVVLVLSVILCSFY